MKSQNLHVLIIGGGIAGPALELLLKKAGISSAVYEAHQSLEDAGGGFTIAPNGMNVLEEIALAKSVNRSCDSRFPNSWSCLRGRARSQRFYPNCFGRASTVSLNGQEPSDFRVAVRKTA